MSPAFRLNASIEIKRCTLRHFQAQAGAFPERKQEPEPSEWNMGRPNEKETESSESPLCLFSCPVTLGAAKCCCRIAHSAMQSKVKVVNYAGYSYCSAALEGVLCHAPVLGNREQHITQRAVVGGAHGLAQANPPIARFILPPEPRHHEQNKPGIAGVMPTPAKRDNVKMPQLRQLARVELPDQPDRKAVALRTNTGA
jgi:hypothetical protein